MTHAKTLDDIRVSIGEDGQTITMIGDQPIDEIKITELKKFCDENELETDGNRSYRSTFINAVTSYLDQPIDQPITTVLSREISRDDFEVIGLLMAQTIAVIAIVLWKIGALVGRSLALYAVPKVTQWYRAIQWQAMGDRLKTYSRSIDPTISVDQYVSEVQEKI